MPSQNMPRPMEQGVLMRVRDIWVEWCVWPQPMSYPKAMALMEARVRSVASGAKRPWVGVLEHPALYTMGTGGRVTQPVIDEIPVYAATRGGKLTYHGPGVCVVYMALPLTHFGETLSAFIACLGRWLVLVCKRCDVPAVFDTQRIGVWTNSTHAFGKKADKAPARKMASIGLRVHRGVVYHGVCLNVDPDLQAFLPIKPCGEDGQHVSSLKAEGAHVTAAHVRKVVKSCFKEVFGETTF